MIGATVTVSRPGTVVANDRLGNPVRGETTTQAVSDVLIQPGATDDMEASRPDGVTVAFTLHFPKTFVGSLEGCEVTLPSPWGGTYRVIGNPQPFMSSNCPTRWNRTVEVEEAHG